jgi:hypothetical protein
LVSTAETRRHCPHLRFYQQSLVQVNPHAPNLLELLCVLLRLDVAPSSNLENWPWHAEAEGFFASCVPHPLRKPHEGLSAVRPFQHQALRYLPVDKHLCPVAGAGLVVENRHEHLMPHNNIAAA